MSSASSKIKTASAGVIKILGWKVWLIIAGIVLIPFILAPLMFFFNQPPTQQLGGQISALGQQMVPAQFLPIYQAAAEEYGIPWNLLAAHHYVETNFSRNTSVSYTGARGHMQFQPCTWIGWSYPGCRGTLGNLPSSVDITNLESIKKYGGYGVDGNGNGKADPMEIEDAIYSAAKYLAANGAADGRIKQAVYAYNHSPDYVAKVMKYAELFVEPAVAQGGSILYPLSNPRKTSDFGNRLHPILGVYRLHAGVDFGARTGTPVYSVKDGEVSFAGQMGGYGNVIVINHGSGFSTRYAHLSKIGVSKGMKVRAGQVIGAVGSTGSSTAPHLHFETRVNDRPVDPMQFLKR